MRRRGHEIVVQTGTITAVQDCGTVIIVHLKTENGWVAPVFFDHRAFHRLLGAEGCGAGKLVGRPASFDGETLTLLD